MPNYRDNHNVVIASLPQGQYGNINAASVLTNLKRTFPSIRHGLMVGIGGAAPAKEDIRLGDIVVGTRVMQYDLGKIVSGGGIQRTAIPRFPEQSLCTAIANLRANHETHPTRVMAIIQERMQRHMDYHRPGAPDRLFQASYEHDRSMANCETCDWSQLERREARRSCEPKIHYGAIASSNQVMKDAVTRDHLSNELDIICFEMEAAGLMDVLPCLPIRGICDYSDSHKAKDWQKYAAAVAAAYAREFLEALPATNEAPRDSRPNTHFEKRPHHHGFLWIRGKPGAGKSIIMKFIYTKRKKTDIPMKAIIISFFFNARGDLLEKSVSGMYRSLLLQLLKGFPDLQEILDDPDLIPRNQVTCPPLNILKDLFRTAISSLGKRALTCFVDALDECDEQQVKDMVEFFEEVAEQCVEDNSGIRLTLEGQDGHNDDLKRYISKHLRIQDPSLVDELTQMMLDKAAGVFLWVALVVDILNEENRHGRIALRTSSSKGLAEITKAKKPTVQFIHESVRDFLVKDKGLYKLWPNLGADWESQGHEELKLCCNAYVFHETIRNALDEQESTDAKATKDGLLKQFPFLEYASQFVLRHADAAAYKITQQQFISDFPLSSWVPIFNIFEKHKIRKYSQGADILYILADRGLPNLIRTRLKDNPEIGGGGGRYHHPLLAAMAKGNKDSVTALLGLPSRIHNGTDITDGLKSKIDSVKPNHTPVSWACEEGHLAIAAFLLDQGAQVGVDDFARFVGNGNIENSHLEIAKMLLEKGADAGAASKDGRTPLHEASKNGHFEIAKMLLEKGEDAGTANKYGWTPLHEASKNGHLEIAKMLLEKGADAGAAAKDGRTPLHEASQNGHLEIVKMLLEKGADARAAAKDGRTPLYKALRYGHSEIAKMLLEKEADAGATSEYGLTPLHLASQNGHLEFVKILR
ncbi:ankyrin repeat-containing domain protein [Fusarium oxysporum II5]|nr:ankyrin repeat-containing domain protein [Fusarium oxysporum II5]